MLQNNINKMIKDYRENNNQTAFEMILKQYEKMIYSIIKNINNIEKDDLYSIAMIGFIKAINTFDENRGNQFNTYLYKVVTNEIYMEIRRTKFEKEYNIVSADDTVEKSEDNLTIINTVPSDVNIEETTIENEEYRWLHDSINKYCKKNELKKNILKLILKDIYTQKEIGEMLNINRSYVSRTEKGFIEFCKKNIA